MSVTYIKQDITAISSGIIAHGVNEQGVMGSGVALAIRNKWPQVYERYLKHCRGYHHGTADIIQINDGLYVANCYTQETYGRERRRYADPTAIQTSLQQVCLYSSLFDVRPIFMPRIGCGLGGLSFEVDVQPVIEQLIYQFPNVDIFVCDI